MDARHLVRLAKIARHSVRQLAVAANTVFLQNFDVARGDLDRLMKIHERKTFRMPVSIVRLGNQFREIAFRHVALDASTCIVMAALGPRIVIIIHHMAVRACLRIVAKVRKPLSIRERVQPQSRHRPAHEAEHNKDMRPKKGHNDGHRMSSENCFQLINMQPLCQRF